MSASCSLDSWPCSCGRCGLQKRPRTAWTAMNSASLRGPLGAVPLGLPSQSAGLVPAYPWGPGLFFPSRTCRHGIDVT